MIIVAQILRRVISVAVLIGVLGFGLVACKSVTTNDTVDYKSSGAVRGPNLAYPPDLVTSQADRRYIVQDGTCLLYTSPSPRDRTRSRMPSSA